MNRISKKKSWCQCPHWPPPSPPSPPSPPASLSSSFVPLDVLFVRVCCVGAHAHAAHASGRLKLMVVCDVGVLKEHEQSLNGTIQNKK